MVEITFEQSLKQMAQLRSVDSPHLLHVQNLFKSLTTLPSTVTIPEKFTLEMLCRQLHGTLPL